MHGNGIAISRRNAGRGVKYEHVELVRRLPIMRLMRSQPRPLGSVRCDDKDTGGAVSRCKTRETVNPEQMPPTGWLRCLKGKPSGACPRNCAATEMVLARVDGERGVARLRNLVELSDCGMTADEIDRKT